MFNYAKQKPLREYIAYYLPGEKKGSIAVYGEGIVLREGRKETPVRTGYVKAIERKPGEPKLGKVDVEIDYYNMFGNEEKVFAKMREIDCQALKKDLGK